MTTCRLNQGVVLGFTFLALYSSSCWYILVQGVNLKFLGLKSKVMWAKLMYYPVPLLAYISWTDLNNVARFVSTCLAIVCSLVYLFSHSKKLKEKLKSVIPWLK
jgi:hypothetical protein